MPRKATTATLVQSLARAEAIRLRDAFAAAGLTGLRTAHALLLVPLAEGDRHASDLAAHLGVSRQAMAQMIATLERNGYLERRLDPSDGRAKLIGLTARGREAREVMNTTGRAIDSDWEKVLGGSRLVELRESVRQLLDAERPAASPRP